MDVSTLHTLTEDLAAFLSEVTQSELRQPAPSATGDVGDLYLRLIDQNVSVASAITGETIPRDQWPDPRDRAVLEASADHYGDCGLDAGYRRSAQLMESAFASAKVGDRQQAGTLTEVDLTNLYERQISDTVIHTWDIALVLGLDYQPAPEVIQRVLRTIAREPERSISDIDLFDGVLTLTGRRRTAPSVTR